MPQDANEFSRTNAQIAFELGEWFSDVCKHLGNRVYDQREMCRMSAQLDKSSVLPEYLAPFGVVMAEACDRHPSGGPDMIKDIRKSLWEAAYVYNH